MLAGGLLYVSSAALRRLTLTLTGLAGSLIYINDISPPPQTQTKWSKLDHDLDCWCHKTHSDQVSVCGTRGQGHPRPTQDPHPAANRTKVTQMVQTGWTQRTPLADKHMVQTLTFSLCP